MAKRSEPNSPPSSPPPPPPKRQSTTASAFSSLSPPPSLTRQYASASSSLSPPFSPTRQYPSASSSLSLPFSPTRQYPSASGSPTSPSSPAPAEFLEFDFVDSPESDPEPQVFAPIQNLSNAITLEVDFPENMMGVREKVLYIISFVFPEPEKPIGVVEPSPVWRTDFARFLESAPDPLNDRRPLRCCYFQEVIFGSLTREPVRLIDLKITGKKDSSLKIKRSDKTFKKKAPPKSLENPEKGSTKKFNKLRKRVVAVRN